MSSYAASNWYAILVRTGCVGSTGRGWVAACTAIRC